MSFSKEYIEHFACLGDRELNKIYGYGLSKPETFGFEANYQSALHALQLLDLGETDIDEISAAIHTGWSKTVFSFEDPVYKQHPDKYPARLLLAKTDYEDLTEEEKEKDRVLARIYLKHYHGT